MVCKPMLRILLLQSIPHCFVSIDNSLGHPELLPLEEALFLRLNVRSALLTCAIMPKVKFPPKKEYYGLHFHWILPLGLEIHGYWPFTRTTCQCLSPCSYSVAHGHTLQQTTEAESLGGSGVQQANIWLGGGGGGGGKLGGRYHGKDDSAVEWPLTEQEGISLKETKRPFTYFGLKKIYLISNNILITEQLGRAANKITYISTARILHK